MLNFSCFMNRSRAAFTLIELLIVMTVIGILAAVAIPQFSGLINKSKEASTKGHLGDLRSAVQLYYGNNDGYYPTDGLAVIVPKYLSAIPVAKLPGYAQDSNTVHTGNSATAVDGSGGWAYNNTREDSQWGELHVNCSGTDASHRQWTEY